MAVCGVLFKDIWALLQEQMLSSDKNWSPTDIPTIA